MGIVVLGAVFVDIKGYANAQYIPNGRNAGRVVQVHGGVARNVVEDIANVELRPTFVSVVDHTGTSDDVIKKLKKHKVNTKYIRRHHDGLGTWLAIFDNSGDVVASISKRPDITMIDVILDEEGDEIFRDADSIVVEMDMERETLNRVFAFGKKYHIPIYGVVSNMSIAIERRDLIKQTDCFVCNKQEAGLYLSLDLEDCTIEEMQKIIFESRKKAHLPKLVVTMGSEGAVYASSQGYGHTPPKKVDVIDTTGCGDAFFAGVVIGLTYGKTLPEACEIGTRLASSVIVTKENVCPRFLPGEFGINR